MIFRVGIDVGSTTVKVVVLDNENKMVFGEYRRHYAHIQETLAQLLSEVKTKFGDVSLKVKITGSGSINLAKALGIEFMQEVVAVASAIQVFAPQTDVAIELGGEDAKIIYFKGGLEERMNGVCAGGTGSFIDQMASLLQTDATGLNESAKDFKEIYPIAARCGVFAKTDIQPLINEGATTSDLSASIFQAVVNQTISGLACGKPIRGCVAFLGGPLHFLSELKNAFIRTLKLTPENIVDFDNSHLFAGMGAALEAENAEAVDVDLYVKKLSDGVKMQFELKRLSPLFNDKQEYEEFLQRHQQAVVKKGDVSTYSGNCFLGIDAGSTTTKLALIGESGELLYSFYSNNQGNPIKTAMQAIEELSKKLPSEAKIVRSCSTGYGELLLKSAFGLDEGEVETVAHCYAASYFDPQVDCVLDIGGQDMKCIKLRNHFVDTILLNEACSSGCGSFIENFANSLGYSASDFAKEALFASNPVDLGTRCTVFMNSNVKQAQKEGACVSDISAGLAYSVVKNAIFKVIKLADAKELGSHIVVQGGTFYNHAVLRAFEMITGIKAICPDISGIMGAFGSALIAKERYCGQQSSMLSFQEIANLTYTTEAMRCGGCNNRCMLTINKFSGNRRHITGNRCEKVFGARTNSEQVPNLYEFKRKRIFDYEPLEEKDAFRGVVGIPRVLNMYENYPFWATFFKSLGFRVILSPFSSRKIYERGMESIPSESECYPAKLAHGHVEWLISQGVKTIFHPCVFFERQETEGATNHYNCPIVVSYPENLKNNVEAVDNSNVNYVRPFIAFTDEKTAYKRLVKLCDKLWQIPHSEVKNAVNLAWNEQIKAKQDVREEGKRVIDWIEKNHRNAVVLAGRPYHIDPEINHGIPEMLCSYGFAVLSEDSIPVEFVEKRSLRVVDQWVYHSRLYSAAEFVRTRDDIELIQLNSFGCGLDAVTTDQVLEILESADKLYTVLKIDEVNNLGAVRIRIRSLLSAMEMRKKQGIKANPVEIKYDRSVFSKKMYDEKYTLIAPQMSPVHFDVLQPVVSYFGYNLEVLQNDNREAVDIGLKFVNNDACFPSITVVGQIMEAVLSGRYNTDKLAILMTQTGGCCRASNYVAFIRRALEKVGLSHIPVVSLNTNGMEKNDGFKIGLKLLLRVGKAVVFGDLFMRCVNRVRPYEKVKGSTNELHKKWLKVCVESLTNNKEKLKFKDLCKQIVEDFDNLPIDETLKKPRVGIVGEILVKYMPLANNYLVDLLEKEGAEAVVPDLLDFLNYHFYNAVYKHDYLGEKWRASFIAKIIIGLIGKLRKPAVLALKNSKRFDSPIHVKEIAEMAKPFLSIGNQYGEGWLLTGEMVELIHSNTPNIVCIQPFSCLPNHVVGKGVIKQLKKHYPQANIVAIDYDAGASEVNQLNRLKLMLSSAIKNCNK